MKKIIGVMDNYEADIILKPLHGEESCRTLYPFTRGKIKAGEIIRYRPLGCPIIHFAKVLEENHGLITVHLVGPCHRIDSEAEFEYKDIGVAWLEDSGTIEENYLRWEKQSDSYHITV